VISNFTFAGMASLLIVFIRWIFGPTQLNRISKISGDILKILLNSPISSQKSSSKSNADDPLSFFLKIHGLVQIRFIATLINRLMQCHIVAEAAVLFLLHYSFFECGSFLFIFTKFNFKNFKQCPEFARSGGLEYTKL